MAFHSKEEIKNTVKKELYFQHFQIQAAQGLVQHLYSVLHIKVSLKVKGAELAQLGFVGKGMK